MMKLFGILFLFATIGVSSSNTFAQSEKRELSFPSGSKILDVQNGYTIIRQNEDRLLVGNVKRPGSFVWLEANAKELSGAKVSPKGDRLLAYFKADSKSGYFQLHELPSGALLEERADIKNFEGMFWKDKCTYYAHVRVPPGPGEPLSGGTLRVFADLTQQGCRAVAPITEPKVPKKESPRYFWVDQSYNIWAYYSNGAWALQKWIGRGNFNSFQPTKNPYVWMKESSYSGLLVRADTHEKKIQPLMTVDSYTTRSDYPLVYALYKGELLELSFEKDFTLRKRTLGDHRGATRVWWDSVTARVILENSQGRYFSIKP